MNTLDWLLDSDPAIAWQAMRDLTDASPAAIAAAHSCVAREGIGAEILARQGSDGSWHRDGAPTWLANLFTLMLLRATGVDPADPAVESAVDRLESGFRWHESFGAKPFFGGEVEPCINGGTLALGAYFGHPSQELARRLVSEQLDDGGWNCEAPKSTRSSFHTTICVLEGLLEYERVVARAPDVAAARQRGEEYLLKRSLFRRLSTGEVANPEFLEFAFPPRYHYNVLRALDYLRDAGIRTDPRVGEALRLVETKRQPDGRWLLDAAHSEALAFPFSESVGSPSRWITLRALRVLRWHEATEVRDTKADGLDLKIRPARPADAEVWERLRCDLWPDGRGDHAPEIASFFAGTLNEPVAVLMAEDSDGKIVAFAELSIRTDLPSLAGARIGYVEGLYVVPGVRGRGVARVLLVASRDWARQEKCTAFASDRAGRVVVDRQFP